MSSRRNDIADPAVKTCAWLSQHKVYLEWLEQKHGLLWIKGKPGAGKSTLMRHAVATIESKELQANPIVASFFFHGRGSLIQKSPLGLFKSLLHQLLQQLPELLLLFSSLFKRRCETEGEFGTAWDWKERDLQDFIKHSVTHSARTHPILLYIDALDECGEENALELVGYFDAITLKSNAVAGSVSLCFSCRHYPLVSLDDGLEICVEDEVNQDIEIYIQDDMWSQIRDKSRADEARDEILSKSRGNFQWVVLVVPRVLQMYKRGRYREIKKIIQAIPSDLGELYRSLLAEVTDDDLPRTIKLMQWICFAQRPLSLKELRIATVIDMDTPYRSVRECQEDEQYADTDEEMARRVVDLSKGLAEVRERNGKQVAQFNHQSVNDYVLDGGLQVLNKLSSESGAGLAHFQLSRSCIRYIAMEEIMNYGGDDPFLLGSFYKRQKEAEDLARKFPFLEYAVTCWMPHAQKVEKDSLPQQDLLAYFHEPSRKLIQRWAYIHRLFDEDPFFDEYTDEWPCPRTTLLHVASRYNLLSVVKVLLSSGEVEADSNDRKSRTPLSFAADNGCEAIVRLLLERGDVEADSKDHESRTPLSYAAQGGHETVVRQLLARDDVDVNSKDREGQTPLFYAAAQGGDGAVVRLLLARDDVDANSKDHQGRTPLFHAAVGPGDQAKTAVKLLLERDDVDEGFKDEDGLTALDYAVAWGGIAEEVRSLLLYRRIKGQELQYS